MSIKKALLLASAILLGLLSLAWMFYSVLFIRAAMPVIARQQTMVGWVRQCDMNGLKEGEKPTKCYSVQLFPDVSSPN